MKIYVMSATITSPKCQCAASYHLFMVFAIISVLLTTCRH